MFSLSDQLSSIVREALQNHPHADEFRRLAFEDLLRADRPGETDWATIFLKTSDWGGMYTFPVLARGNEADVRSLLDRYDWDVMLDFYTPRLDRYGDESVAYVGSMRESVQAVEFRPLVVEYPGHSVSPDVYDVAQEFRLFYGLVSGSDGGEMSYLDIDGGLNPAVRMERRGDFCRISVRTHVLRDFLAASGSWLLLQNEHHRESEIPFKNLLAETQRFTLRDGARHHLVIVSQEGSLAPRNTWSFLRGKDLIGPYSVPKISHRNNPIRHADNYESFTIGVTEDGDQVEASCAPAHLGDWGSGSPDKPDFLTPVFFDKRVLQKYYDEPRLFQIENGVISRGSVWGIDFDSNAEELVQVWLGDLARIPHIEQRHWRSYNVIPRAGVTQYRLQRDFGAKFVDSPSDVVRQLQRALEDTNAAATTVLGGPLFSPLRSDDVYASKSLHIPLTDEPVALDRFVQSLAKLLPDSIDVERLAANMRALTGDEKKRASIAKLALFLEANGVATDAIATAVQGLQMVQAVRSSAAAHRKGRTFDNALKKFDLDALSNRGIAKHLAEAAERSLRHLRHAFIRMISRKQTAAKTK